MSRCRHDAPHGRRTQRVEHTALVDEVELTQRQRDRTQDAPLATLSNRVDADGAPYGLARGRVPQAELDSLAGSEAAPPGGTGP